MLGAKELAIAWGDNPQHWYWRSYPGGSRFAEVAELQWVCWLEIRGKLEMRLLSPNTFYAAYLVIKFKQDVYGFDYEPVTANIEVVGRVGGSNSVWCSKNRQIHLSPNGGQGHHFARKRGDGWMEVEMGHFYNGELEDGESREVHMSVLETERLGAKYGLIVQGMEVRPKVDT
ncbi:hypothetical protein MKW94_017044 [Papaver nudicaule]|uniref:Uncharacterized protein n=1 Tax=Papaver nudicaule TaxID=74823 RepID=A0AA41V1U7_PAPNU|nr:hypothetical protein [Papaver nudicaule]